MQTFFHGTRFNLPLGEWISFDVSKRRELSSSLEKVLEFLRPPRAHSRKTSFFLVTDPELIPKLGPAQKKIYLVFASDYTKVNYGWIDRLEDLGRLRYVLKDPKKANIAYDYIQKYWAGEDCEDSLYEGCFEYLANEIFIQSEL